MRWFRKHVRMGTRLALFALAVQLVLTFGHVHLDGAGSTNTAAASSRHVATGVSGDAGSKRGSQGTADADCPICALIQLASTSAPSVAPPLPVPFLVDGAVLETTDQLRSEAF